MSSLTTGKQTAASPVLCAVALLFVSLVSQGQCQTTSPPPTILCSTYKSCESCTPHAKCLWCFSSNNCTDYPRPSSRPDRDEERFIRKREEIKQRAEQRKVDRKTRHDEIRKKYGLMGDADHPYSKFENE
uniref:Pituitary tumor-transforming 1 interacting protein a n=1 Tax=Iconisemion striatum TaxID=60296 RepID=A0A1A7X295_9TELE